MSKQQQNAENKELRENWFSCKVELLKKWKVKKDKVYVDEAYEESVLLSVVNFLWIVSISTVHLHYKCILTTPDHLLYWRI